LGQVRLGLCVCHTKNPTQCRAQQLVALYIKKNRNMEFTAFYRLKLFHIVSEKTKKENDFNKQLKTVSVNIFLPFDTMQQMQFLKTVLDGSIQILII
jgi:hypothetical protein